MKYLMKSAVLYVFMVLCALSSVQAQTDAKVDPEKKIKGHTIIHINKMVGLYPKLAMINSGTTVIWMNDSASLATIQFRGKAVTIACRVPTNFILDKEGSFVSNRIPQGAVASLCFIEKGTYNYVLSRGPRTTASVKTDLPDVHGTIIVE